jgi:transcription elongation factor GreA
MGLLITFPDPPAPGVVELGSGVRVRDADGEDDYVIVSRAEADAARGRISEESPVGRALLGRGRGAQVDVTTPSGIRRLTIVDIAPPSTGNASPNPCLP